MKTWLGVAFFGLCIVAVALFVGVFAPDGITAAEEIQQNQDPWTEAVLLNGPELELLGEWASVNEYAPPTVEEKNGAIVGVRINRVSKEQLVVPASSIESTLASGTEVSISSIPDDCRIALHWSAANESVWPTEEFADSELQEDASGNPCAYVMRGRSISPEEYGTGVRVQNERHAFAMHQVGPRIGDFEPAGGGEVTIISDGTVIISHSIGELDPEEQRILCGVRESGDVYFWAVSNPE